MASSDRARKLIAAWCTLLIMITSAYAAAPHPAAAPPAAATTAGPDAAQLIATIPLPHVHGRIDHLAVDIAGQRLFVAAVGNDTLEVVDLLTGRRNHTLTGLHAPQGVLFVPAQRKLYVTNGGNGRCSVFDADTLQPSGVIDLAADADNIRYDRRRGTLYIGSASGTISAIDAATQTPRGQVPLAGHPESFQLERNGPRIFVNIPQSRQIAVLDRVRHAVLAIWPVVDAAANFPMALAEKRRRLFIGSRRPARLDAYDIESGTRVARVDAVGDMDDLFFDAARQRLYAIGGEGFVDVFSVDAGDRYTRIARLPTRPRARTGLWVPAWGRLYVALPQTGDQDAEIRVYAMPP